MTACACCLSALQSRFVSRFGRARADDRFSAFNSTFFARSMFGSCRSLARRRRASCAETAMWEGHCCLHGPSHQGSHPRLSPWLRPSANVSRLEAPFCCFMARARATLNEQCQPSERRGFAKLVERRRGLSSRHRRHASDNRDERKARFATVRHTRVSHTRHT